MKRLGSILAVLAVALALLVGAAGGAVAQVDTMDHHDSHHTPSDSGGSHHKAALVVVAPCCPAAEAPTGHVLAVPVRVVEAFWQGRPALYPDVRDITPEPPPPKARL